VRGEENPFFSVLASPRGDSRPPSFCKLLFFSLILLFLSACEARCEMSAFPSPALFQRMQHILPSTPFFPSFFVSLLNSFPSFSRPGHFEKAGAFSLFSAGGRKRQDGGAARPVPLIIVCLFLLVPCICVIRDQTENPFFFSLFSQTLPEKPRGQTSPAGLFSLSGWLLIFFFPRTFFQFREAASFPSSRPDCGHLGGQDFVSFPLPFHHLPLSSPSGGTRVKSPLPFFFSPALKA